MVEAFPVDLLVQTGAVGIAIALVILTYLRGKAYDQVVANHVRKTDETISKNADAMLENAKANVKLAGVIEANTEATKRNSDIMDRVQRLLDGK